ncbi:MAG: hypothetical protein D6824_09370 [Planctomycetota bacterium]|nr:MAG: hypothetical protein D6824_09370 [Planctomycetota bacterium]
MELVAVPGWSLALVAGIASLLILGALEALATKLGNDRDRHDLIVQAMQLREEHLRRIEAQMRGEPMPPPEHAASSQGSGAETQRKQAA